MKAVHYIAPTVICLSLLLPIGMAVSSDVDRIKQEKKEKVQTEKDKFLHLENADSVSIAEPVVIPPIKFK